MLPIVIPEILITPFKYWLEGVQEGMYHSNELFTLVKVYGSDKRTQAYEDACQLADACQLTDNEVQICVTVSELQYCLWQNLKSYTSSSKTQLPDTGVEHGKQKPKVLVSQ